MYVLGWLSCCSESRIRWDHLLLYLRNGGCWQSVQSTVEAAVEAAEASPLCRLRHCVYQCVCVSQQQQPYIDTVGNLCSCKWQFAFEAIRVSIQGVKSLWGDRLTFLRLGTGDTDRWCINKGLFSTYHCPQCPILEKRNDPPKVM